MRIAITSQGKDLNEEVSPRFWRCPYFILYDTATDSFEICDNARVHTSDGVGIQAARILEEKGVDILLTGAVYRDALRTLSSIKIDVFANLEGRVSEVLERFRKGL